SPSVPNPATFEHIVLVSFDGARKHWIDHLIQNGTLKNLASIKSEGVEIPLIIVDHDTKTDPGMACIESGYGPDITGIDRNYFGSLEKKTIPGGLTISERIKAYNSSWKTALVMPWTQAQVNVTSNIDSTFWNQREETDYWFSSENLTWSISDPLLSRNALSFTSALLRANFTASKVVDFIRQNYENNFYARVHFVEPDMAGHAYLESADGRVTAEYMRAVVESDEAVGMIVDVLKEKGIYEETALLITTDHGFYLTGHNEPSYPFGNEEVSVIWLLSNYAGLNNTLGWGIQNDIAPTILALAGIETVQLEPHYSKTSRALPIWEANTENREMTPPTISTVVYSKDVYVNQRFNVSVTATDASGILHLVIHYHHPILGWRDRGLSAINSTAYRGSVGPFPDNSTVYWYIVAYDNSTHRNAAFYPQDKMPLSFIVQAQRGEDHLVPTQTIIAIILVTSVGLGVAFYFLRVRKRVRPE
ncbi:MAG: alkaline phosphatase family protein, partial [Candidatus Bathyarchaeia archaeon]